MKKTQNLQVEQKEQKHVLSHKQYLYYMKVKKLLESKNFVLKKDVSYNSFTCFYFEKNEFRNGISQLENSINIQISNITGYLIEIRQFQSLLMPSGEMDYNHSVLATFYIKDYKEAQIILNSIRL